MEDSSPKAGPVTADVLYAVFTYRLFEDWRLCSTTKNNLRLAVGAIRPDGGVISNLSKLRPHFKALQLFANNEEIPVSQQTDCWKMDETELIEHLSEIVKQLCDISEEVSWEFIGSLLGNATDITVDCAQHDLPKRTRLVLDWCLEFFSASIAELGYSVEEFLHSVKGWNHIISEVGYLHEIDPEHTSEMANQLSVEKMPTLLTEKGGQSKSVECNCIDSKDSHGRCTLCQRFECAHCSKKFVSIGSLNRHGRKNHKLSDNYLLINQPLQCESHTIDTTTKCCLKCKFYICHSCDAKLLSKAKLSEHRQLHRREVHDNDGDKISHQSSENQADSGDNNAFQSSEGRADSKHRCSCHHKSKLKAHLQTHMLRTHSQFDCLISQCSCKSPKHRGQQSSSGCGVCGRYWCLVDNCQFETNNRQSILEHFASYHPRNRMSFSRQRQ